LFVILWLRIAVFDPIKNGMASKGDPFEQFHGVGFEQSSLAELSPLGVSSVITTLREALSTPDSLRRITERQNGLSVKG